jgi:hypothetical protein
VSSLGISGSATYAVSLSGIEQMMDVLPDNTANDITAQDVRNVVYTLYEDLQGISSFSFSYTNLTPSTNAVGNWGVGSTFSNVTLQQLFDGIFNVDLDPTSSLVVSGSTILDYKSNQSQESTKVLTWTATKKTYSLNTLGRLQGTSIPGGEVSVTVPSDGGSGTYPTTPLINQTNTYTFITKDIKDNTSQSSVTVRYQNRYYWGSVTSINPFTLSSQITDLSSTNVSVSGSGGFATSFTKNFDGIDGGGQYLCWAFPTAFGTPKFTVNGLPNTAFTKINSAFSFVNSFGYTAQYDVWVSNTTQNSPIDKFQIT